MNKELSAKDRLTGFWAEIVKLVLPKLTDENFLDVAEWVVEESLQVAIADPQERYDVIVWARSFHAKVGAFLDRIDAELLR